MMTMVSPDDGRDGLDVDSDRRIGQAVGFFVTWRVCR